MAKAYTELATFTGDTGDISLKSSIIHELGHALGFKHSGDYYNGAEDGPFLPTSIDHSAYTVMSYNEPFITYATPMIFDAQAMQYLYGANHHYNSGNTRYVLTNNMPQQAIWDGGGNDTLDSSGYTQNVTLDLREGYSCVSSVGTSRIWLDYGSNIENAVSGNGNDVIYGNHWNNNISSGAGNDTIYLVIGDGNDTITSGGDTTPTVNGSGGNDTVNTGVGNDSIAVNSLQFHNTDNFINSGGNDSISITGSISSTYNVTCSSASATDNITLQGGNSNTVNFSGAGTTNITVRESSDTIFAGAHSVITLDTTDSNADMVVCGGAAVTIVMQARGSSHNYTINNFSSTDHIQIARQDISTTDTIGTYDHNHHTENISLSTGMTIYLTGLTSAISASQVALV